MARDCGRRARFVGVLAACSLLAAAGSVVACSPNTVTGPGRGLAPAIPGSAVARSTQVDFRDAETVVLAYLDALRSGNATEAAVHMTRYRRAEVRAKDWRRSNAWWNAVRITAVSRPGHYLTDEPTFVRLYTQRFGHAPFKLIVLNVAYSAEASAPAGDIDFVVTQDTAHTPWLVHDYGGAVFAH